jgi:hypothetical protein
VSTRANLQAFGVMFAIAALGGACSSMPAIRVDKHAFPKEAFIGEPKGESAAAPAREYEKLGLVKTKVEYPSLNMDWEETALCRNYFNKAVKDLVKRAKDQGGDAVIHVKAVTFMVDGRTELHDQPECADDGEEGQVLAQGIAIKWKKTATELKQSQRDAIAADKAVKFRREASPTKAPSPADAPLIRGN